MIKPFLFKTLGSLGYILQYGCVVHCTFEYLGDFVVCSGPSMEPTLYTNDVLFTEHISVLTQSIKKGDIIISKSPNDPKQLICKRVVAVQGEKVKTGFGFYEIVPVGHVWLQGDNVRNSADSRIYGAVPLGLIRSRAVCKVWPLKSIRMLNDNNNNNSSSS